MVAAVEIASGNSIRTRGGCSEAVMDTVRNSAHRERRAGQIAIRTGKLPSADQPSNQTVGLERKIIDAAHAEVMFPIEIGQSAIRAEVGRIVRGAAAIKTI